MAGPPYLTDDPQPTDPGRWEIYNYAIGAVAGGALDGEAGVDLNYGAAKDLQLTAVLPLGFHDARGLAFDGLRGGTGVIELAAKYRFLHQFEGAWTPDVSIFPRLLVPTNDRFGTGHVALLLPLWAQRDAGPWSVFWGGGYQINPGAGQRSFWQGGLAVSRTIGERLSLGAELYAQQRSERSGGGFSAVNFAATYKLVQHWSLLTSAGPTWDDRGAPGSVFYLALKADY